jgi:hypothetical protein
MDRVLPLIARHFLICKKNFVNKLINSKIKGFPLNIKSYKSKHKLVLLTIISVTLILITIKHNLLSNVFTVDTKSIQDKSQTNKVYNKPEADNSGIVNFQKNYGQLNQEVLYYTETSHGTVYITQKGLVFNEFIPETHQMSLAEELNTETDNLNIQQNTSYRYQLDFINAQEYSIEGNNPINVNYLTGKDNSAWVKDSQSYEEIILINIYPGIDLKLYGKNNTISYDYIVKPNSDPENIELRYDGIEKITIENGELVVKTLAGIIKQSTPKIFQNINGSINRIQGGFKLKNNNSYGFYLGEYNKNHNLIIDPVITFSSYIGGSSNDYATAITHDIYGNIYLFGDTYSNNYPIINGYQQNITAQNDFFITKLTPDGKNIIFSTYLGGSGNEYSTNITVDNNLNIYITGYTTSANYPIVNGFQNTKGPYQDLVITKLNPSGSDVLYSSFLGGNDNERPYGMTLDSDNNVYLHGYTWSTNFPIKNAYQSTNAGGYDVFLTKFDTTKSGNDSLIFSTYFGGDWLERGFDIKVTTDSIYLAGKTGSSNLPTVNPIQSSFGGPGLGGQSAGENGDVFVSQFSLDGSELLFSTYLGGSGSDTGTGLILQGDYIYIAGYTNSTNFPILNAYQTTNAGAYDFFVTKITKTNPQFIFSTYYGGSSNEILNFSFQVDYFGAIYFAGRSNSTDYPVINAIQEQKDVDYDGVITKLSNSGNHVYYSTYLGGNGYESILQMKLIDGQCALIIGYTTSSNFPTVEAYQNNNAGGYDSFYSNICNFLDSYTDREGNTSTNLYDYNSHIININGEGYSEGLYNVYYYDDTSPSGNLVYVDSNILVTTNGELRSSLDLSTYDTATPGTWYSLVTPSIGYPVASSAETILNNKYYYGVHGLDNYVVESSALKVLESTGEILINNDDTYTNDPSVILNINGTDTIGTILQMKLSSTSNFSNSSWESYATTRNWEFDKTDGIKSIYVIFKDESENTSLVFSDSIKLDSTSPIKSVIKAEKLRNHTTKVSQKEYIYKENNGRERKTRAVLDGGIINRDDVAVTWKNNGDNDGSGIKQYNIFLRKLGLGGLKGFSKTGSTNENRNYYVIQDLKDGKYEWFIEAVDKLGNRSKSDKYTFSVDTKAPDIKMLTITNINYKDVSINHTSTAQQLKIKLGEISKLVLKGQTESNSTPYIEIYNKDKSIKYQEIECIEGSTLGGNVSLFACLEDVWITTSPYTFTVYVKDKAGNRTDGFDMSIN